LLLAPATLILQVAHPAVGAAVIQHSTFPTAPWSRLLRTARSIDRVIFGPHAVALAESERLRRVHGRIRGVDGAGRSYRASDPAAYAWVHLTLFHFFVEVQRLLGCPLSSGQRDQLYREWRQVGALLGLQDTDVPLGCDSFARYFDDMIERTLERNRAVDDVLAAVARPEKPLPFLPASLWDPVARRAGRTTLLFTVGTLPPRLRERFGVPWTSRQAASLDRESARLRTVLSIVPDPLLVFPTALPYLIRARFGTFA
jgi:uncharacterized protein (DUF2236 family)